MDKSKSRRHLAHTTIVMFGTLLSRLLGFVRARVLALHFGTSGVADVINFSFNLPNNFRKLLADGSFHNAYVPVFSSAIEEADQAQQLLKRMHAFQILLFVPLVITTYLLRRPIVLFFSDFKNPAEIALSAELISYFMLFLVTISFAALYQGILHCHSSFLVASLAPLAFSVAVITAITMGAERYGAYSMAIGTIVGGTLQALISFVALRKYRYRFTFSFDFSYFRFRQVMRAWVPVMVISVLLMIGQQVAFYFASTLPTGSVTAFSNALIFWQTPYGIFFTGIATVYLPAFVATKGNLEELATLFEEALSQLVALLLPATIILFILRRETVAITLQGGRFTFEDTLRTAAVLSYFAVGMLVVAAFGLLQRVNYALLEYRKVVIAVLVVVASDIALTWLLLTQGWQVEALSLANAISYVLGLIVLIYLNRNIVHYCKLKAMVGHVSKIVVANIPLGVALLFYRLQSPHWYQSGGSLLNLARLALMYLLGALLVLVPYRLFKIRWATLQR